MHTLRVSDLSIGPSPRRQGLTRLSVMVHYPGRFSPVEDLWYEIPDLLASDASHAGDPWLMSILPLAVLLGRPLEIDLPVDAKLLANTGPLMEVWSLWYAGLSPVPVEAPAQEAGDQSIGGRTAQLFSGGVDSFFTLLTFENEWEDRIDELLFIHGFDFSIHRGRTSEAVFNRLDRVASKLGKELVPIATNLRMTRFQEVNWTDVGYGSALAGAALVLGPRYRRVVTASGMHPGFESHSGSHKEIDPHFSTSATSFVHHGFRTARTAKLEYLSTRPLAFDNIRVCFTSESGENCGSCMKCLIVMSIMEVMGNLKHTQAFLSEELDLDRVRRVYLARGAVIWRLIQSYALENGREDVAEAIEDAFRRTARIDRWLLLGWVRGARQRFRHHAAARRVTRTPRRILFAIGRWLNRWLP